MSLWIANEWVLAQTSWGGGGSEQRRRSEGPESLSWSWSLSLQHWVRWLSTFRRWLILEEEGQLGNRPFEDSCGGLYCTRPSFPLKTLRTLAMGQWLLKVFSSRMTTMSPTCRLGVHFWSRCNCWRYSIDHLFQKWEVTAWHKFHLRWRVGSDSIGSSG